jgi:hypothetical protein
MCGRFGLHLETAWTLTPGEFEDWLAGAVDGARDRHYWGAATVSAILRTMGGHTISPEVLLGEAPPDDGDALDDPHVRYLQFKEDAKRNAERDRQRERAAYLPEGIVIDEE